MDPSLLVHYADNVTGKRSKPQKVLLLKLKVLLKDKSIESNQKYFPISANNLNCC